LISLYWWRPAAFDGTSNAINVVETPVNQPIRTAISTIPASSSNSLARRNNPADTTRWLAGYSNYEHEIIAEKMGGLPSPDFGSANLV
jgi:hypothetical protein